MNTKEALKLKVGDRVKWTGSNYDGRPTGGVVVRLRADRVSIRWDNDQNGSLGYPHTEMTRIEREAE